MKITQIVCQILRIANVEAKTASSQDAVIVRVRTDSGLEGIGEADASPEVVKAIVDAPFSHNIACGLREILVGENPLETERLWQKMYRRTMYFGRTSVGIAAMAAVDMALWDLKGKHYGEPIHRLLGGKQHDTIGPMPRSCSAATARKPADIARRWREAGYTAVKCGWEPMGTSEAVDIDLVRGAREGVGDGTLLIDAGCVWDARTALAPGARLRRVRHRMARRAAARRRPRRLRLAARSFAGADRLGRRRMRPRGVSPLDRSPGTGCLSGRPVALRVYRRRVHSRSRSKRYGGPAVQSLLHQPADRGGQLALAGHLPRRVFVRRLRRRLAAASRADASKRCRPWTAGSRSPTARAWA